jgi:hypothetical protein
MKMNAIQGRDRAACFCNFFNQTGAAECGEWLFWARRDEEAQVQEWYVGTHL